LCTLSVYKTSYICYNIIVSETYKKYLEALIMCFESAVGCVLLTLALVGYVVSRFAVNVNWALHMYYLRCRLNTK
jgi:hypothetical protein